MDSGEPRQSAAAVELLRAYAAPVLQLCLRLRPPEAAHAERALPKLAPQGGWTLPAGHASTYAAAAGKPSSDGYPVPNPSCDPVPTAAQQAAVSVCLLQQPRLWGAAGTSGDGGRQAGGGASDPNPTFVEALAHVACACMATLANLYRQGLLSAEVRECHCQLPGRTE